MLFDAFLKDKFGIGVDHLSQGPVVHRYGLESPRPRVTSRHTPFKMFVRYDREWSTVVILQAMTGTIPVE